MLDIPLPFVQQLFHAVLNLEGHSVIQGKRTGKGEQAPVDFSLPSLQSKISRMTAKDRGEKPAKESIAGRNEFSLVSPSGIPENKQAFHGNTDIPTTFPFLLFTAVTANSCFPHVRAISSGKTHSNPDRNRLPEQAGLHVFPGQRENRAHPDPPPPATAERDENRQRK